MLGVPAGTGVLVSSPISFDGRTGAQDKVIFVGNSVENMAFFYSTYTDFNDLTINYSNMELIQLNANAAKRAECRST